MSLPKMSLPKVLMAVMCLLATAANAETRPGGLANLRVGY